MKFTTQAKFSRRVGYSKARISQLVKEGKIVLLNGMVEVSQALEAMKNKGCSRRLGENNRPQKQSLEDLRIRIQQLEVRIAALENLIPLPHEERILALKGGMNDEGD
jgi:hypothetical protein